MNIKHITSILIISLFLICLNLKSQTVYVTNSGKKHHAKNCSLVKTGKKGIKLSAAKKQGFVPCKICKSDAIEDKSIKNKETKVKPKS